MMSPVSISIRQANCISACGLRQPFSNLFDGKTRQCLACEPMAARSLFHLVRMCSPVCLRLVRPLRLRRYPDASGRVERVLSAGAVLCGYDLLALSQPSAPSISARSCQLTTASSICYDAHDPRRQDVRSPTFFYDKLGADFSGAPLPSRCFRFSILPRHSLSLGRRCSSRIDARLAQPLQRAGGR